MTMLVGIAGSLRSGSLNMALLQAAATLVPEDVHFEIGSIKGIPLYNWDIEAAEGIPSAVMQLQDLIAEADGLIITTPEYNHSIPGVIKNVVDWLSRPPSEIPRVFGDLPVAIMGASPGGFGTTLAQAAWLPVLKTLGAQPWSGGRMLVSHAKKVFDEEGELIDEQVESRLREFLDGFLEYVSGD